MDGCHFDLVAVLLGAIRSMTVDWKIAGNIAVEIAYALESWQEAKPACFYWYYWGRNEFGVLVPPAVSAIQA